MGACLNGRVDMASGVLGWAVGFEFILQNETYPA